MTSTLAFASLNKALDERSNRRLQPLRYLHDCSDCFRLERLPGGACTHWKAPPLHGARQQRTSIAQSSVVREASHSDQLGRRFDQSTQQSHSVDSPWNSVGCLTTSANTAQRL